MHETKRSRGQVLVVDDDDAICGLIADIVGDLGLETVCANTDAQAYTHLASLPAIRALIADVNLGTGTTGFDVARFARQAIPHLPVIYISGQSSQTSFQAFGVPGSVFVQKPFTPDELLGHLRPHLTSFVG